MIETLTLNFILNKNNKKRINLKYKLLGQNKFINLYIFLYVNNDNNNLRLKLMYFANHHQNIIVAVDFWQYNELEGLLLSNRFERISVEK